MARKKWRVRLRHTWRSTQPTTLGRDDSQGKQGLSAHFELAGPCTGNAEDAAEGEIGKTLQRRLQDRISRARKIRLLHSICATGQRRIRHDRRIGTGPVAFAQLNKQSKSTDTEEISMGRGDQRSKRGKIS